MIIKIYSKSVYPISDDFYDYSSFYAQLLNIRYLIKNYILLYEYIIKFNNLNFHCMLMDIKNAIEYINLSDVYRKVLFDYMIGYSLSDIGKKYKFTRSYADFIIKNITIKLRDYLLGVCNED